MTGENFNGSYTPERSPEYQYNTSNNVTGPSIRVDYRSTSPVPPPKPISKYGAMSRYKKQNDQRNEKRLKQLREQEKIKEEKINYDRYSDDDDDRYSPYTSRYGPQRSKSSSKKDIKLERHREYRQRENQRSLNFEVQKLEYCMNRNKDCSKLLNCTSSEVTTTELSRRQHFERQAKDLLEDHVPVSRRAVENALKRAKEGKTLPNFILQQKKKEKEKAKQERRQEKMERRHRSRSRSPHRVNESRKRSRSRSPYQDDRQKTNSRSRHRTRSRSYERQSSSSKRSSRREEDLYDQHYYDDNYYHDDENDQNYDEKQYSEEDPDGYYGRKGEQGYYDYDQEDRREYFEYEGRGGRRDDRY